MEIPDIFKFIETLPNRRKGLHPMPFTAKKLPRRKVERLLRYSTGELRGCFILKNTCYAKPRILAT